MGYPEIKNYFYNSYQKAPKRKFLLKLFICLQKNCYQKDFLPQEVPKLKICYCLKLFFFLCYKCFKSLNLYGTSCGKKFILKLDFTQN